MSRACALSLLLSGAWAVAVAADPPSGADKAAGANDAAPPLAPQENFFSSVKQAFKEDFEREVVRGHFDVGSPPDNRRYYCLVDAKTGKSQPNAVAGETVSRKDGMTGIKGSAVSGYSCASAEQLGMLVTTGYVLHGAASRAAVPVTPAPAAPAAVAHLETPPPKELPPPPIAGGSPGRIEVDGVTLGMSVDEVRVVLRSKKLRDYHEWTDALGHGESTKAALPMTSGRFVNSVAAWSAASTSGDAAGEGESVEVMFTPVPGKERVMAIVYSVSYAAASAVRESALDNALVKKYGGYPRGDELPASPTWRVQSSGGVQVGDPCNRRGTVDAGVSKIGGGPSRPNLALKTTLDEFQFQIDHCGVAIVSEDHSTVPGGASKGDPLVSRFTVTAYSPSIGFQGASMAAQWLQSAEASTSADPARTAARVPTL